jgi:GGDEF domain-containing protein
MAELEKLHALQLSVLENYTAVLRDIEQYAVEIDDEITSAFRRHVMAIACQSGLENVADTRSLLRNELRDYRDRAAVVLNRLRRELSEKVYALQAIVEAMASADGDHEERLHQAILNLRKLADTSEAEPVRAALLKASGQIETSIEEIKKQNSLTIGQFIVEIKALHNRIEALEVAGRQDRLTGMLSRIEMESRICAETDRGTSFSLLLLRICNLPIVRRQFGAEIRSDVIAAFAKRLMGGLPDNAIIGRWSEDHFLALLHLEKRDSMALAKRLNEHVSGTYVCMADGEAQRPSVQVNVAVIENPAGGSYESLIGRLNQL